MKKNTYIEVILILLGLACIGQQAKAQFIKMDDFTNSTFGVKLVGQFSDGPSGAKWLAAGNGSSTGVVITNSPTPGAGQPGSGTPVSSTTNAAVTTTVDGAASLALPTGIPTSSTQATVFFQFDMGNSTASNNVNWAIVNTPGSDAGGGNDMVELNANAPGRYGLTFRDNSAFKVLSPDGVNEFVPLTNTIYNMWVVINNSAKNFIVYMQDANPSGTDLPNLTRMWLATTADGGSAATFTYTTNAIAFRNQTAGSLVYFVFGNGGGGLPPQYTYSIYEDAGGLDLTNPVTGAAPVFLAPPVITSQPQPAQLFAGANTAFSIAASGGSLMYQWRTNGVAIGNGGNVSGANSNTLTITGVSAANALNYSCMVSNANVSGYKSTNSAVASLTIVAPNGAFETALAAARPLHFYAFDETGDPSTGTEFVFDYGGGDNGVYGANSQNGFDSIAGPRSVPDGFPGFSSINYAAAFSGFDEPSHVTVNLPWNFNTNTVTITAWIYPTSPQDNSSGIVFNRGGGNDVGGLNISTSGNSTLGYTWNNDPGTTSWDSGLQPPQNQWSFVALVVTPTNATIYMMNTNGLASSIYVHTHATEAFGGTTMIGDDSGTTTGARTFVGSIDEVAVFNQALSQSQLQSVFTNASGVAVYGPSNTVALITPLPIYPGQSAQFSSINEGSVPLYYTWQLNGVNLADGANSAGLIIGSTTPSLTISNLAVGDAGNSYNLTLVTSNSSGSYTSSVPAVLTVSTPNAPQTIYTLGFEAPGADWDTGTNWADGNPASYSVYSEPESTYQVAPGTLERTPAGTNASFPGTTLVLEGNGVLLDGNTAVFPTNTTTGELRLKQSGTTSVTNFGTVYADGGSVYFPDLQLNGGQLDNGTSSKVTINGQLDMLADSSIYADSGANGAVRSIQINAFLTGTGTLSYAYLSGANYTNNDLIVTCPTNTFSGQWNIVQGTLLGNAPNSLGTNNITVGTNAALETTYNIYDPGAGLNLNGTMFLYTSNTFNTLTINGRDINAGTYTFAQLNAAFPLNFPATWPVQVGSTTGTNSGFGCITVLISQTPVITQQPTPGNLSLYPGQTAQFTTAVAGAQSYQWWFTNLSNIGMMLTNSGGILGAESNILTISSVAGGNAGTYTLVVSNAAGSITSSSAMLTILPPGPATTITMSVVETSGQDWNTGVNWSDGNPASLSAYSEPGSTYIVLPGALLLTPAIGGNDVFPGVQLVITNSAGLLLEHSGAASIVFEDLQLNGGLMDNGADGLITLTGELDVSNNVVIYTDTNQLQIVVNFDVGGGIGGTNYTGLGAYPDAASHTNWNPIVQSAGAGTTTAPAIGSDGVSTSPITLTINADNYGEGNQYGEYGPYNNFTNNSAGTLVNTPVALAGNYLYIDNTFTPNPVVNVITNTLDNVPTGTYNLYLYGNNGGNAGGPDGQGVQNDRGTLFTVSSDSTAATSLITTNKPASLTSNTLIQGADYVVFSNVVVGAVGTITITWTANVNITAPDGNYAGQNARGQFNGLQLVTAAAAAGPRPTAINSLLTGNGTINYDAGDTNFESDLEIAGIGNTFSGQWNVMQGALLGGAAGSLGTNTITVGANGALETAYNINNTNSGLVLNGRMFLHTSDTFKTLTVNGAIVSAGTYTFAQLHGAYPANFPSTWPTQTNSVVNTGSGQITVLSPPGGPSTTTLVLQLSGSNLSLSWTNGGTLQTTTNLTVPWTPVVGASSPYTVIPTNKPSQFYRVHP